MGGRTGSATATEPLPAAVWPSPRRSATLRVLDAAGISDTAGFLNAAEDEARLEQVRKEWCAVTGQRSGITWHYMQMLAGIPGVKSDRMICRSVADSLGLPRRAVTPTFALEIVTAAAKEMGMSPTDLDHGVWQFQRVRR